MKKNYLYLSAVVLCVIMFLGWYFLARDNRPVTVSHSLTPDKEAPPPVISSQGEKAYITGEVINPGVYEISPETRIEELLELAGGASDNADLTKVNLSAKVKDEQQVTIPSKPATSAEASGDNEGGLININTASKEKLTELPGIGAVTAAAIIEYREVNGFFSSIDQLIEINNIGEKTLERIKDKVTVN